jgi:hypothetical protein
MNPTRILAAAIASRTPRRATACATASRGLGVLG